MPRRLRLRAAALASGGLLAALASPSAPTHPPAASAQATVPAPATAPSGTAPAAAADPDPFEGFARDWRDDPAWEGGRREVAVYEAAPATAADRPRSADGAAREGAPRHEVRVVVHKELADPQTKTRSLTGDPRTSREAFRLHLREDRIVPGAEAGAAEEPCSLSIMSYVGARDLKSLKLEVGRLDEAGAAFKWYVNHAGTLEWQQYGYAAGEGRRGGSYHPPRSFAFADALGIVLRGYPFERPRDVAILLLPSQTDPRPTPTEPAPATVRYLGRETLDLPYGRLDAHRLRVAYDRPDPARPACDYWFAADAAPPLLGALVRVEVQAPGGQTLRLRTLTRQAAAALPTTRPSAEE